MTELVVKAPCGVEKEASSRQEAEDKEDTHDALCDECDPGGCTIERVDGSDDEPVPGVDECVHCEQPIENGHCPDCDNTGEIVIDDASGDTDDWEVGDSGTPAAKAAQPVQDTDELPERNVSDDPLTWMPGHFIDQIDGSPAINRKGFEVLAHHYNISTTSELEVPPEDAGHEYCRVKARATTDDGRECEAYGSAHVDRGDDKSLLLEMADTRARKRALSVATGVGTVAIEELQNEVE